MKKTHCSTVISFLQLGLLVLCFVFFSREIYAQESTSYRSVLEIPEFQKLDSPMREYQFEPKTIKNSSTGKAARILLEQNDELMDNWFAATFSSPEKGIVVGTGLSIYSTENAGKTWKVLWLSKDVDAFLNSMQTPNHFYVVGNNSHILRASKKDMKWEAFDSKTLLPDAKEITLYKIIQLANKDLLLIGGSENKAILLLSKDAGDSWSPIPHTGLEESSNYLLDLVEINRNRWVALDDGIGKIYVSEDQGRTWKDKTTKMHYNADLSLKTLAYAGNNLLYAAGYPIFWRSKDAGETWESLSIPEGDAIVPSEDQPDQLGITKLLFADKQLYASSSTNDISSGRKSFVYRFDPNSKLLKPILKNDSLKMTGESFDLQVLNENQLIVLDKDRLYLINL